MAVFCRIFVTVSVPKIVTVEIVSDTDPEKDVGSFTSDEVKSGMCFKCFKMFLSFVYGMLCHLTFCCTTHLDVHDIERHFCFYAWVM